MGSCERLYNVCLDGVAGEGECSMVYNLCLDNPDIFMDAWLCNNAPSKHRCLADLARHLIGLARRNENLCKSIDAVMESVKSDPEWATLRRELARLRETTCPGGGGR